MAQETRVQSQVKSYQSLKKWYLIPLCLALSIIRYRSKVSSSIQRKELYPPLHLGVVAIEKRAFRSPNFLQLLNIYIYLYLSHFQSVNLIHYLPHYLYISPSISLIGSLCISQTNSLYMSLSWVVTRHTLRLDPGGCEQAITQQPK